MENLTLQQLINQTREALIDAGASKTYLKLLQSNFFSTQKNIARNLLVWILDCSS